MTNLTESQCDLTILEQIEKDPDTTQASLAAQLGVAVGTINWHLKRLISKGYVKAKRAERRKLRYLITPDGIALRAHLTVDYIQSSFSMYRLVRQRMLDVLELARFKNYNKVQLIGEGDVAEICRLTCLEQGVEVVNDSNAPRLIIKGLKVFFDGELEPEINDNPSQ
ncbi:MAG: winged helix-turn-helix domain-containing protein [Anaerolineae bacterium]|nr:winged helix-turn-helix domain-containing protein [Anaerolineae bacterium]